MTPRGEIWLYLIKRIALAKFLNLLLLLWEDWGYRKVRMKKNVEKYQDLPLKVAEKLKCWSSGCINSCIFIRCYTQTV